MFNRYEIDDIMFLKLSCYYNYVIALNRYILVYIINTPLCYHSIILFTRYFFFMME